MIIYVSKTQSGSFKAFSTGAQPPFLTSFLKRPTVHPCIISYGSLINPSPLQLFTAWLVLCYLPPKPFLSPTRGFSLFLRALGHWASSGKLSGHLPSNVAQQISLCSERYFSMIFYIRNVALITCYYHLLSVWLPNSSCFSCAECLGEHPT